MENDRIAKRVYVRECVGSYLVAQLWKRWNDSGQARKMVYDRNEWREFVMVNAWGIAQRMDP